MLVRATFLSTLNGAFCQVLNELNVCSANKLAVFSKSTLQFDFVFLPCFVHTLIILQHYAFHGDELWKFWLVLLDGLIPFGTPMA